MSNLLKNTYKNHVRLSAAFNVVTKLTLAVAVSVSLASVTFAPHAFSNSVGLSADVVNEMPIGQYAQSKMVLYHATQHQNAQTLVMVHGIGGTEGGKFYNWDRFLDYSLSQNEFKDRFNIVLFAYDSGRPVDDISRDLTMMLEELVTKNNGQSIRVLAYSEGGLLVRNALESPVVNDGVEKVITIATPFQGSPLANADWVSEAAQEEPLYSPVRLSHRFAYWLARKKHPSFEKDFSWKADEVKPLSAVLHANDQIEENVDRAVGMVAVAHDDEYDLAGKKNFIVYGSYFGQQTDPKQVLPKLLGVEKPLPKERFSPKNLFRKNILFTYINKTMGRLNPKKLVKYVKNKTVGDDVMAVASSNKSEADTVADTVPGTVERVEMNVGTIMAFNDGISPINSSLWLDRYDDQFQAAMSEEEKNWKALQALSGTGQARLFQAMDHRNWMDGFNRTGEEAMVDLLNPNDQPKNVFDWILHDLMS